MTTVVPPTVEPFDTSSELTDMGGQYVHAFDFVADVYVEVTTTLPTSPFVTLAAVVATSWFSELTVKDVAATPLKETAVTLKNPEPFTVTTVPPELIPFDALRVVIAIVGQYVQAFVLVADVKEDVTTTSPVPFEPGEVTTVICDVLSTVKEATDTPLNVTDPTE